MNGLQIEDIYELSPLQQGIVFDCLRDAGAGLYVEQYGCVFEGDLDAGALERAWQEVVDRHAVLRTSFHWQDLDKTIQVVHREVPVELERLDWRALPEAAQEAALEARLRGERERGFDLAEPPLLRLALIRLGERTHRFLWTYHHLLLDGWSLAAVLSEVLTLLAAAQRGEEIRLPVRPPFGAYVEWLHGQDLAAAEDFWRRELAGFAAPTSLPGARPAAGPGAEPGRQAVAEVHLSEAATEALRAFARRHQLTLGTVLQGAWAVLLARHADALEVVFGTIVSGRPADLEGAESMIGLFINTLPVRARVPLDEPLVSWLRELQVRQARARQFEHAPLAAVQRWSEVPPPLPLFESLLVFENYPVDPAARSRLGGLEVRDVRFVERASLPLVLEGGPARELYVRAAYDEGRLEAAAVGRLLDSLRAALEGVVDDGDPGRPVGALPLLARADLDQIVIGWNRTASAYPRHWTIPQAFEDQARRAPDAPAVSFGDRVLTYAELDRWANRLANRLRRLGVGPDAPVVITPGRSLELVVGLLAILKAGGAYVPLDPGAPREWLAGLLADLRPRLVLAQEGTPGLPGLQVVRLSAGGLDLAEESGEAPRPGTVPANLAYIVFTSGSTGRPKGVCVAHASVLRLVKEAGYTSFGPHETFLLFAPVSFDASTFEIWGPLLNGGRLVVFPPYMPTLEELGEELHRREITTLWITSGLFRQMVEHCPEGLTRLRQILSGGDIISLPHVRRVVETLPGCRMINCYGPTEGTTFTTCHYVRLDDPADRPVPIGRPIAETRVYVVGRDGRPVPVGAPGELWIGGDGLARGYLNRPELTAERFIPDPFSPPGGRLYRTGDLVRFLPDGALEFLDRLDEQVKVRGFRIEPGEIEAALGGHPGVRQAVVLARQDEPGDKRLVAYVVPAGEGGPDADELRALLHGRLPDYMVPAHFVFLEELPVNANGKVDRRALPAPEAARPEDAAGEAVAPRTPAEAALASIWKDVLRLDQVGVHDGFFALGGDSIISLRIVARAREAGYQLSVRQIFEHGTIAALAQVAVAESGAGGAEQGPVTGPVPLTPIQRWFLDGEPAVPHHFNQGVLLELREPLPDGWLERLARRLEEHHDALRLRLRRGPQGWEQENAPPDGRGCALRLDLSALAAGRWREALDAAAQAVQASLDLAAGPLLRLAVISLPRPERDRLLFVVHHLAVDGVSWRLLLEDFNRGWQQLARGEEVRLPPKTTSFRAWAEGLAAHARSGVRDDELGYWLHQPWGEAAALPLDLPHGENTEASARTVAVELGEEETRALLQEVPRRHHATIEGVLLGALAWSLSQWAGEGIFQVDLEGHGREEIVEGADLSRTVGWFTALYPVLLDVRGAAGPGEAVERVQQHLRAVPDRGLGFGLLRHLGDGEAAGALCSVPASPLSFNYLGQLGELEETSACFAVAGEGVGPDHSPHGRRTHLLEVDGMVVGGVLRMSFLYSAHLHRAATIEDLARRFAHACRALAAGGNGPADWEHRPEDFPLAALDELGLDALSRLLEGVEDLETAP